MSYTVQNFISGQKLKAEHLNHIEDGIAALSNGTTIPSFWKSYIDNKITEINTLNKSQGGDADTFIFITDTHLSVYNNGDSFDLIKYILERTSIKKVVFGGDMIAETVTSNALTVADELVNTLKDVKYYFIRGNHDIDVLEHKAYYDLFYRNQEEYCELNSRLYYHFDDKVRKIRYIALDPYSNSDSKVDEEQLDWMKERINELEDGWTVLIFQHRIWNPISGNASLGDPDVDAQAIITAIDSTASTRKCSIAGIISGHSHRDYHQTANGGYFLMSTACDANGRMAEVYDYNNPSRPAGTTSSQVFDVINFNPKTRIVKAIRIGAGSDREFTY